MVIQKIWKRYVAFKNSKVIDAQIDLLQITKWQFKYCKTLNICFLIDFYISVFIKIHIFFIVFSNNWCCKTVIFLFEYGIMVINFEHRLHYCFKSYISFSIFLNNYRISFLFHYILLWLSLKYHFDLLEDRFLSGLYEYSQTSTHLIGIWYITTRFQASVLSYKR